MNAEIIQRLADSIENPAGRTMQAQAEADALRERLDKEMILRTALQDSFASASLAVKILASYVTTFASSALSDAEKKDFDTLSEHAEFRRSVHAEIVKSAQDLAAGAMAGDALTPFSMMVSKLLTDRLEKARLPPSEPSKDD